MEPITLCGAVIVVFGLYVEFEGFIAKAFRAVSSKIGAAMPSPTPTPKPLYVRYMTGS